MTSIPPTYDVSTENVVAEVIHRRAGVKTDPRPDYVGYLAFTTDKLTKPSGAVGVVGPLPQDWHAADWESAKGRYFLTVLVGPENAGLDLATGKWHVWYGLIGPREVPVVYCGPRTIK